MEHLTWSTVDKSSWGDGPWQGEPDKEQWQDEATGLACLVKRSHFGGSLCGYVGVPEGHPWHGKGYSELEDVVGVHGGLTYADLCQEDGPEGETICHIPGPGEPEPLWWVGFDCGHAFDFAPGMAARERAMGIPPMPDFKGLPRVTYRTIAYVKSECAALARQAELARMTA